MNWMTFLPFAALAVLVACYDSDDPTAPRLPTEAVAARSSKLPLNAPSNTNAVGVSETHIDIVWQDNSTNETGFEITRSYVNGYVSWIVNTPANVVKYSDSDPLVTPASEHCYRVRAVRVSGNNKYPYLQQYSYSDYSNIACVRPPLAAPSDAMARSVSENQIDISWQDNSGYEYSFEVQRSATGDTGSFSRLTATNAVTYSDIGIASGTQYCYRVRAVQVLPSTFSNTTCATTGGSPPPPPDAASGTNAKPYGSRSVLVTWTDNASNEDGFRVDRSTDDGAVWELAGTNVDAWFVDSGLQSEQPVCYRVVAFNVTGDAPPSSTACTTPPAGPTNLTATRVDAQTVELSWLDNSNVEDGYVVWLTRSNAYCYSYDLSQEIIADLPANSTTFRYSPSPMILTCDTYEMATYDEFSVNAKKDGGFSDGVGVDTGTM